MSLLSSNTDTDEIECDDEQMTKNLNKGNFPNVMKNDNIIILI